MNVGREKKKKKKKKRIEGFVVVFFFIYFFFFFFFSFFFSFFSSSFISFLSPPTSPSSPPMPPKLPKGGYQEREKEKKRKVIEIGFEEEDGEDDEGEEFPEGEGEATRKESPANSSRAQRASSFRARRENVKRDFERENLTAAEREKQERLEKEKELRLKERKERVALLNAAVSAEDKIARTRINKSGKDDTLLTKVWFNTDEMGPHIPDNTLTFPLKGILREPPPPQPLVLDPPINSFPGGNWDYFFSNAVSGVADLHKFTAETDVRWHSTHPVEGLAILAKKQARVQAETTFGWGPVSQQQRDISAAFTHIFETKDLPFQGPIRTARKSNWVSSCLRKPHVMRQICLLPPAAFASFYTDNALDMLAARDDTGNSLTWNLADLDQVENLQTVMNLAVEDSIHSAEELRLLSQNLLSKSRPEYSTALVKAAQVGIEITRAVCTRFAQAQCRAADQVSSSSRMTVLVASTEVHDYLHELCGELWLSTLWLSDSKRERPFVRHFCFHLSR